MSDGERAPRHDDRDPGRHVHAAIIVHFVTAALDDPTIERDLRRILWVQAIRAALYGFGTVVLGTALADSGLSDTQVGLVFTAMLAGMALATVAVGVVGDRVGRRRLYTWLLIALGVVGAAFALTDSFVVLIVARAHRH